RRPAAVVRDGGDVLDRLDLHSRRLQGADRRLAAGSRPLDPDLERAQPVLLGRVGGGLSRDLRREGSPLAGALEPVLPGAAPRQDVPLHVRDADDRVVERGVDVRDARRNDALLLLLAAALLLSTRHSVLSFLADGLLL